MVRRLILPLLLLSCTATCAAPFTAFADETPAAKKEKKKQSAKEKREAAKAKRKAAKAKKAQKAFEEAEATTPVGLALKKMEFIGANRPDVTAEFYFIVRSSSTCPHCVKLLPEVMAAYAEMRATGKVELIYESFDNDAAKAEEHLNKQGATFPAAYVVDAQGKRLASGPLAPVLADWRKLTVDKQ
ncbi:MAG: hypothetical protein Q4A24_07600 [Akkermansia sp.]|nr:hypothetical protein [Akkermansia sp.]